MAITRPSRLGRARRCEEGLLEQGALLGAINHAGRQGGPKSRRDSRAGDLQRLQAQEHAIRSDGMPAARKHPREVHDVWWPDGQPPISALTCSSSRAASEPCTRAISSWYLSGARPGSTAPSRDRAAGVPAPAARAPIRSSRPRGQLYRSSARRPWMKATIWRARASGAPGPRRPGSAARARPRGSRPSGRGSGADRIWISRVRLEVMMTMGGLSALIRPAREW